MCIACELGYWSMIDALAAERSASEKQNARTDDADFACEASDGATAREPRKRAQRLPDEPAP